TDEHEQEDGAAHDGTSSIAAGLVDRRRSRVDCSPKALSRASTSRKKRLRLARPKLGTENTGWCGRGRPFSASIPSTAASAAKRIVISNVTTMNAGHECSGLPPTFSG